MRMYYPEPMGEPTPSALGSEPGGTHAFIQASERIVGLALRSLGGRYARVYRIDAERSATGCVASTEPDDASLAHAGFAVADIAFSRLASNAARGTPDVLAEPACRLDPATRELIRRQGLGALATAAIRVGGTMIGSLVLADRTGRCYAEPDLLLLSAFADQVALVVENARLEAETTRQRYEAGELALVASLIGERLDPLSVGQRIAESVLGLLGVHSSVIRLFQPDAARPQRGGRDRGRAGGSHARGRGGDRRAVGGQRRAADVHPARDRPPAALRRSSRSHHQQRPDAGDARQAGEASPDPARHRSRHHHRDRAGRDRGGGARPAPRAARGPPRDREPLRLGRGGGGVAGRGRPPPHPSRPRGPVPAAA